MKTYMLVLFIALSLVVLTTVQNEKLKKDILQYRTIIDKQSKLIDNLESLVHPQILRDTIIKIDPKFKYLKIRIASQ